MIAKDLGRHRVVLAGYGAAVAVATALGMAGTGPSGIVGNAVILLGAILAVLLVHGDPPFRSNAFWAMHPITPSAVYGAKLALIFGGIMGAALVGQGLILARYGVAWAELPGLLLASLPAMGSLLLAGLLMAVSFRTMGGIAAAVAGAFVLLPFLSAALFMLLMAGVPIPVTPSGIFFVWGAAAMGGLVWAGLRYVVPTGSVASRLLGTLVALVVLWGGLSFAAIPHGARGEPPVPYLDRRVAAHPPLEGVTIELLSMTGGGSGSDGPHINVSGTIHAPRDQAGYRVWPESARLRVGDGPPQDLEVDSRSMEPPVVTLEAASSRIGPQPSVSSGFRVRLQPDPAQWEALRAGGAAVELTAVVERLESHKIGTMPFQPGASVASGGTRIRHGGPAERDPETMVLYEVTVGSRAVVPLSAMWSSAPTGTALGYALISDGAEEGLALRSQGASGGGSGPTLYARAGLLLPGPAVREWRGEWAIPPAALDELDRAWLDRARLHAFRWRVVGTDRIVSAPVELTVPEARSTPRMPVFVHPETP